MERIRENLIERIRKNPEESEVIRKELERVCVNPKVYEKIWENPIQFRGERKEFERM